MVVIIIIIIIIIIILPRSKQWIQGMLIPTETCNHSLMIFSVFVFYVLCLCFFVFLFCFYFVFEGKVRKQIKKWKTKK